MPLGFLEKLPDTSRAPPVLPVHPPGSFCEMVLRVFHMIDNTKIRRIALSAIRPPALDRQAWIVPLAFAAYGVSPPDKLLPQADVRLHQRGGFPEKQLREPKLPESRETLPHLGPDSAAVPTLADQSLRIAIQRLRVKVRRLVSLGAKPEPDPAVARKRTSEHGFGIVHEAVQLLPLLPIRQPEEILEASGLSQRDELKKSLSGGGEAAGEIDPYDRLKRIFELAVDDDLTQKRNGCHRFALFQEPPGHSEQRLGITALRLIDLMVLTPVSLVNELSET